MKNVLLRKAKLWQDNSFIETDILIKDKKIEKIDTDIEYDGEIIDLKGKLVTPGLVDVHVHFREPGFEHKETIESGSKAAARGGFTLVCPMPNTNPIIDNVEKLERVNKIIEDTAVIKVLPYVSITEGLQGDTLVDFEGLKEHGAFAYTDDGVGVQTAKTMYDAMKRAAELDMAIVAHTEDNSLAHGGAVHEGDVSERLGVQGIPSLAESTQIARDVLLAEQQTAIITYATYRQKNQFE